MPVLTRHPENQPFGRHGFQTFGRGGFAQPRPAGHHPGWLRYDGQFQGQGGILRRKKALQDTELDAALRRRISARQIVQVPSQLGIDWIHGVRLAIRPRSYRLKQTFSTKLGQDQRQRIWGAFRSGKR